MAAMKEADQKIHIKNFQWQQDKNSLLQEVEKSRAVYVAQLDRQKHKNNTILAALKKAEQQLENHLTEWWEDSHPSFRPQRSSSRHCRRKSRSGSRKRLP